MWFKTLISILKSVASTNATTSTYLGFPYPYCIIEEFIRFHTELREKLTQSLDLVLKQPSLSTMSSACIRLNLVKDVREFVLFSLHMRRAIEEHMRSYGQSLPMCVNYDEFNDLQPWYVYEIYSFYNNFIFLKIYVTGCLERLGMYIEGGLIGVQKDFNPMLSCYLSLLKELNNISKLFRGEEDTVSSCLKSNMLAVNYLILHSKSAEHQWILEHKNIISVESRRNLMRTIVFPVVKYDNEMQPFRILIDRSQLLTESFEQITRASPKALHNGLLLEFKNESGAGNGVLREWLYLVCQALFDPHSSLFLACPSDRRRFFPNPAKMDPRNLNYFRFCGRVIALALMNKVQVGIAFDRVFFLQLAGEKISLEDISYADPCMYNSWKKILEMDANFVDSDAMGLTFVNEVEEFGGSRKIVELVPGGNTIVVNSKNREEYVNLRIQHCFVKSVSAKVAYFSKGFGDILSKRNLQKYFFRCLELEDLDCLLLGSDKAICVKDWKAHTDYHDVKETDDQICWFWKVVEDMSVEQQRELLFFWTSVKYLPVNGFSGMPSRLCIYKTKGSHHNLLSSHTCYYRLGLPYYPSLAVMQKHLFLICQEHVGHSLGFS